MHAVTAPDHRRHFVTARLRGNHAAQLLQIARQDFGRFSELNGQGRVENVGRGQPLMNPTRSRANGSGDISRKANDTWVVRLLFPSILRIEKSARFRISAEACFRLLPVSAPLSP